MPRKASRRSSGIPHIDELSQGDQAWFMEAFQGAPGYEISEKVDGSARITFGLHEGRLWTQSKHGNRRWTAESYGDRPFARALREAHAALASRLKELREHWPTGVESMTADVLHTRVPNVVEYGRDMLVVHSHPPAVVRALSLAVGPTAGGWTLEAKNIIDPQRLRRPDGSRYQNNQADITEMLRDMTSAHGYGMVEGLVVSGPDGRTVKLVDRVRFTEMNKFMWSFRERLDRGVKVEGVWRPGIRSQMRRNLAEMAFGHLGLQSPGLMKVLSPLCREGLDEGLRRFVEQKGLGRPDFNARAVAAVKVAKFQLETLRKEWTLVRENMVFRDGDWSLAMHPLIRERTDAAIDDASSQLDDLDKGLASADVLSALKLFLGPDRLERLSMQSRKDEGPPPIPTAAKARVPKPGPPPVDPTGATPLDSNQFDAPSPAKVDEDEARRYITKFRGLMQAKRGLNIPARPAHLGTGTRGAAFDIGGGRAIKITADDREAMAANRLKTAGLKHVVKVYDVFRFKDSQIFGVVQDRLEPLSSAEKEEVNGALISTGLPVWLKHGGFDWNGAKRLVIDYLKKKAGKMDPADAREYLEEANKAWTLLVQKYHVKEMVEELKGAGIEFQDYHAGNIMKQGSSYVLIDVGYSKIEGGKQPDVLERMIREITEATVTDVQNRGRKFDNAGMQELVVRSAESLSKRGVDIGNAAHATDNFETALEYLGGGSFGFAYEVVYKGKPACLKVTEDTTEAKASNHLKGKKLHSVVQIYDVFQFKGHDVYGIVQELLKPLDGEYNTFDTFANMLRQASVGPAMIKGDWDGVMSGVFRKLGEEKLEKFVELAHKFGFPDMIEELAANGIEFLDYHSGNIMKRGKNYVVIDLGMSRSPGALPDVMEGADDDLTNHNFGFEGQYSGADIFKALHKSDHLLRKHGIVVDLKKRLGNGVFGIAYECTYHGERCCIKVTGEVNEAKTSNHIKGKELLHLCNVHEVFRIPSDKELFIIVQELLTQPSPGEKADFHELLDVIYYESGQGLEDYVISGDVKSMINKVRAGQLADFGSEIQDQKDPQFFMERMKQFGIAGAIKEMHDNKIHMRDFHAENIMKRGDDFVFIDPGLARSPGALPNMIERVIRSLSESKADQVGVTIGRYQPFHRGHAEVIRELASKYNKVIVIVAGNKRDERNPFSYDLRVDMMKRSLPDVSSKLEVYKAEFDGKASGYLPGVLGSIIKDENSSIEMGTAVNILVGPDRFEEVKKQIEHAVKYKESGKEVFFDPAMATVRKIEGVTDDDTAERVSATQVRQALADNDTESLKKLLDPHLMSVEADFEKVVGDMQRELGEIPGQKKAVKKESLTEDLAAIGEAGVMGLLADTATLLSKKGISIEALKPLGQGKMGIAFDMGSNKVLKVTTDDAEAKACNHLRSKGSPEHVVKIFDVFQFPRLKLKVPVFGIIQEKLTPLSSAEEKEFDEMMGLFDDDVTLEKLATGTWKETVAAVKNMIERNTIRMLWHDGAPTEVSPKMKRKLDSIVDGNFKEFLGWSDKFNVGVIVDELRGMQIKFADFHGKNMMKRGGTFVINDLGKGRSPGAQPPVLERFQVWADQLMESMQTPRAKAAVREAFNATSEQLGEAAHKTAKEDKGKDVGFGFNAEGYPIMDRYDFQGLDICIENKKGSKRHWGDKPSEFTKMCNDYGYVDGYEGADGDEVDVYVGPDKDSEWVYVVHQLKVPKFEKFDEDKVMIGFSSEEKAKKAYLKHYDRDDFYGGMSVMKMDDFKKRIKKREGQKITNELFVRPTSDLFEVIKDITEKMVRKHHESMGMPKEAFGGSMGSKGSSNWSRPPASPEEGDTDPLPHNNRKKPV